MIRILLMLISFLMLAPIAQGQKVKYKELFVLLNASQFDTAEPHLKRYLKENSDNPNAHYYMGVIYHEKTQKSDPLVETDFLLNNIDSALYFFDLAFKGIDERELKKNDEYYESFSRRDIRTGKFEVKLSDIQLQLEERMKALREKSNRVKVMKMNFVLSSTTYQRSVTLYQKITEPFANETEMLLLSNEELIKKLKVLGQTYDSSVLIFNQYKTASQAVGKTGHNQVMTPTEIKDIKRDGVEPSDFLQEHLKVWDYKSWSGKITQLIEKEVFPMRARLISFDIEINNLRTQQKKDSLSVINQVNEIQKKLNTDGLLKLDPDPLPIAFFNMNLTELTYTSEVLLHRKLKDSVNVKARLDLVRGELKTIQKVDSFATNLEQREIEKEGAYYADYIAKAYGTIGVLKSNIKASKDYAARERLKREKEWERISQTLKWVISGTDSIPLFAEEGKILKHRPLIMVSEDHTAGLKFADTLATGYFYTITPTRIADVKASFPVDPTAFKKRNMPLIKGISTRDATAAVYFILYYSEEKKEERFPATVVRINRVDGVAWSKDMGFEFKPTELHFSNETGELTVKITSNAGDSKIVTLDKSGNVVQ